MYFGSQYYRVPHPTPQYWEYDLKRMKELGFNTVKFWAVWNGIEKAPGKYDYSELDALVSIADKNGLKVVINIIPEGAPYWLETKHPDALYTTAKGQRLSFSGEANMPTAGWPGLCMDKPEAAECVCRFIENLTRHFKDCTCVEIFDIWNEPHLEPMFAYKEELLCYCEYSRAEFRKWLERKYGSVEELNRCWYRRYSDWEQIQPPTRMGTWMDMMDWREFWLDNLCRWMRMRVNAARKGAPGKIIQTHVAYSGVVGNRITGGMANEVADEFKFAREVDLFGTSGFPKWLMGDLHPINHLMQTEIVAEAAREKRFYQVELQGGPGKNGLLGTEAPTYADVKQWNWNTITAGGKGVVYWQYRPEPSGLESPGFGLVGLYGENRPRTDAASEFARQLTNSGLDSAVRLRPVNGIYISRTSQLLCFGAGRLENLYAESIAGAYRAAYRAGIPVRFVHADYVESILEEGLKTLYLPMPLSLSVRERDALRRFVEAGGTIVSEAFPGLYDEGGRLDDTAATVSGLFGVTHREVENRPKDADFEFTDASRSLYGVGRLYREVVEPGPAAEVLCRFCDGEPAVTVSHLGEGTGVLLGSFVSNGFYHSENEENVRLITKWMDPVGYDIAESISVVPEQTEGSFRTVVRLHHSDQAVFVTAVNHTAQDADVTIIFRGNLAEKSCRLHVPAHDGCMKMIAKRTL